MHPAAVLVAVMCTSCWPCNRKFRSLL